MQNESKSIAEIYKRNQINPSQLNGLFNRAEKQDDEDSKRKQIEALKKLNLVDPSDIAESILSKSCCETATPTGFQSIDKALGGGLKSYLYVIGAGSSLGKTTLAAQMADQIAASGKPVLFVTIEQSGREIVLKTLSRIMAELKHPATVQELESIEQRDQWDDEKKSALEMAVTVHRNASKAMRIITGNGQPTAGSIREAVRATKEAFGDSPVVFVDYLQLLAPDNDMSDERQTTNRNITALKQIARDFDTPVFVISSLNRSGYNAAVSLDSFKESGAIEYTADVLMGLQPRGLVDSLQKEQTDQAKRNKAARIINNSKTQDIRQVELTILKHRMGVVPKSAIPLTFYPAWSTFIDDDARAVKRSSIVA